MLCLSIGDLENTREEREMGKTLSGVEGKISLVLKTMSNGRSRMIAISISKNPGIIAREGWRFTAASSRTHAAA